MNFRSYLSWAAAERARADHYRCIRIVLGNESCDLDSVIAASVYAYYLHSISSQPSEILHLPVLNTTPDTFRLRTEIRWFLRENASKMIFINDLPIDQWYLEEKLELVLVDHHVTRSPWNHAVVEILDHHQIKPNAIVLQDPSAIRIEPVGSCCTLIAEKLLENSSRFAMNDEIASLLIGPIVFDTVNFSDTAGKVTEKDRQIYDRLLTFCSSPIDREKLYADLKHSASDTAGLTVGDLLRKDAKQVQGKHLRLVMSSLPMNYSVQKLLEQCSSLTELNEFLSKNDNADALIITSIETTTDSTKRQLAIYAKDNEHLTVLNDSLHHPDLNLNLHEREFSLDRQRMKFFDQENVRASRKQILPFLEHQI